MHRVGNCAGLALAIAFPFVSPSLVSASTIATFSDPSVGEPEPPVPLFAVDQDASTISASYPSLTLETWDGSSYDVSLLMNPVTFVEGRSFETGAGSVQFMMAGSVILQIDFDNGHLNNPFSFGATEFIGDNVTFSGSALLPFTGVQDGTGSFAFSFANQTFTDDPDGYTATAAFTSSGVLIPEPATLIAVALFGLVAVRGHRR
jgi:hypothetical protein